MDDEPLLLVGEDGRVIGLNQAARDQFGAATGRFCRNMVGADNDRGRAICREGCVKSLILSDGSQTETHVRVRGGTGTLLCTALGDHVAVRLLPSRPEPRAWELTARELEILRMVAEGLTSQRIARRLGLQFSTVRTHVEHIRQKVGARTRAEAVAIASRAGLIEAAPLKLQESR